MFLYYYILSIPILILSNMLILFNKSFFYMWMVMEINLISFISILIMNKFIYSELILNYFLIQSFNSQMFLMINLLTNLNFMNKFTKIIIFLILMSKMGMPPFHMWYLKMMKFLNWMIFFINSSMQKFIPLMILNYYFIYNNMMFYMLTLMTLIICSIMPLFSMNTSSMKLLMSFSSMIQISWILILMNSSEIMWILYFNIYNLINLSLCLMFYYFNINYIFNFNSNKFKKKTNLYFISIQMFSLAGLPPFTGFLNKWMFINNLFNFMSIYFNLMILVFSLMNLFFYSRTILQIMMFYYNSFNLNFKFINYKNIKSLKLLFLMIYSMFLLTLYEMI
uniref:NADH dehydrogenase subunit 2 n=1 Tax=Anagyrus jenniferae TaxID=2058195 RepID=UPI002E787B1C|nr:NADH dehydrogenase subunit 2 [Anagyrus jenniferae]WPT46941.1 NADH dehydrogenase subunit 2 [Anagyrus jenniferae]